MFGIFKNGKSGKTAKKPGAAKAKTPVDGGDGAGAGRKTPPTAETKREALRQIRALRQRVDPEVLDGAERLAKHQMGIPNDSMAVALLERARANGGKDKARVIAEIHAHLARQGITVED
ncbi:MAG: hypothetical protein NXI16_05160 [Alphaproteobacteria bacterium]|nr:hypothetical protein [Alphaproteobacteria bacterium]